MKKILVFIFCLLVLLSCSEEWDSHYGEKDGVINDESVNITNKSFVEYLKSDASYKSISDLFFEAGIFDNITDRDQLFTVLVVNNDILNTFLPSVDDKQYFANSHISNIAISPSNLSDNQRVFMWNKKYINISKKVESDNKYNISFNNAKVKKIIKAKDAYIYELDEIVDSPKSMYEIIENLGDDYSIFRDMIMSKNKKSFDKNASYPIGVDNTGSTVYDSVFVITNPYFLAKKFDIMSESLTATMLIPSNDVISNALNTAKNNLNDWGLTRADSIMENWVFQSAFFNRKLSKNDFAQNEDLTSIFDKQWRTTVQKVNLDAPISMSNGTAYYIDFMKIPTNVLIYRLKDYMKGYEFLSEADKNKYFASDNLKFNKLNTDVAGWSGWPAGGFPLVENRVLIYDLLEPTLEEFTLNFVPFKLNLSGGTYTATPYRIPPGEYDLCLGFKQNLGFNIEISFNGKFIRTISTSELTATTYHYDRGGQGYPEGYDINKATDSKKGNYDRDGGRVGVVTIDGTEPVEIEIKFHGVGVKKQSIFHHWCLRPTANCY